jgi:ABC-type nitrate/sulfonate/bicarbonate transport system substrate-binding protein
MLDRRTLLQGSSCTIGALACQSSWIGTAAAQTAARIRAPIVYAAPGLAFASLFVATRAKLWDKHGVAPELNYAQGGALGLAAINSGNANFSCVASSDPVIAWGKGARTLVVAAFYGSLTVQMAARNDWMKKVGVEPGSPVDKRVQALRGARIGAATVGGGPAQYTRYLGSIYGLDPDKDIRMVPVGQGPARIAALRENRVDVIVSGAPEGDQVGLQGFGALYINYSTDVPVFTQFPFTVLVVKPEFAEKNPDQVRRVAQSIGAANDFVRSNFDEAVAMLKAELPKINPKAIDLTMRRDKNAFAAGGRMNETMWANGFKVAQVDKRMQQMPPLQEGAFWTNKYLA